MYAQSYGALVKKLARVIKKIDQLQEQHAALEADRGVLDAIIWAETAMSMVLRVQLREAKTSGIVRLLQKDLKTRDNFRVRVALRRDELDDEMVTNERNTVEFKCLASCVTIVMKEKEFRLLDKKAGISLKRLVERIPPEIRNYTKQFLPYKIQFLLLEHRWRPFKLMKHLNLVPCHIMWCKMFDIMVHNDKLHLREEPIDELVFKRNKCKIGELFCSKVWEMDTVLFDMMYFLKEYCPKDALKLMKAVIVLIKPTNICNESNRQWLSRI
jgi:hypothetical protein